MTAARVTACCILGIAALLFVAGAAAEQGGRTDASAGPNEQLATRVEKAIGADTALTAARIEAEVSGGVVALRGSVSSAQARVEAVRIARSVSGVRAVRDELRVAAAQDRTKPTRF